MLTAWSLALLAARVVYADSSVYAFLVWNLVLALVPLCASSLLRATPTTRWAPAAYVALFGLWLAFLPNAPYLATDLFHLRHKPPVPLWFDLALLLSFTVTGLAIGFRSLADIQQLVARRTRSAFGWAFVIGCLFASAFGIYVGRFLRWNSWDLVVDPARIPLLLLRVLTDPAHHPRALGVTAVFGALLTVLYVVWMRGCGHDARNGART